ncbi:hypothetical protein G9P44_003923 [Scheffersomyces stipitis]|nr:hypothetical protein G9P44_003923 [Scheffersomyces stipitis]
MGPVLKKQKLSKGEVKKVTKIAKKVAEPEVEPKSESELSEEDEQESDEEFHSAEDQEDLSDLEMDDDVDVADVSSSEEGSADDDENEEESDDENEDEDDSFPTKMKKKKNLDDGSESFATALNAIVGSKLKAYDRKDPILARNKVTLKKLESDKLENKAKRALLSEKKQLQDKHRVRNILPSASEPEKVREIIQSERQLKKVAQKGVVRLFNAVLSTQIRTNQEVSKEKVGQTKKEELMNEISKEKFLDLVQAAGQS